MTLRVLVPLLGILAALAWGATHLVNGTTRSWFERDVSMRARLEESGARDALPAHLASGDDLVVVHDLSVVSRREAAMRRFTIGAFGVVALLASIATFLVRRFTWRTWTEEIRSVLTLAEVPCEAGVPGGRGCSGHCSRICGR